MKDHYKNRTGKDAPFLFMVRFIFVVLAGYITHQWANFFNPYIQPSDFIRYDFFAVMVAITLVFIESQVQYAFPQEMLIGVLGMLLGLITSILIQQGLPDSMDPSTRDVTRITLHLFLGYMGVAISLRYAHRVDFSSTSFLIRSEDRLYGAKVLDTSTLIDGRIQEILESGFIEGLIIIPSFVVNELQMLSDSHDHMKRSKGRRGLDISKRLQKIHRARVEILSEDFPNLIGVDKKLIALTRKYEGQLVTMDYNLNKVCEIEKIETLNINQLALSVKTAVLSGEHLHLRLIREGKEANQGVGYTDNGTMVVVDRGKPFIDQEVMVVVESILQTSAGKMIFAKLLDTGSSQ